MEPFSIACTTCQARLRVRDDSAIGQILTCPKCGSMVLVEPPPSEAIETPAAAPATPLPESAPPAVPASDFTDAAALFEPPASARREEASEASEFADTVEDISVQGNSPLASPPRPAALSEEDPQARPAADAALDSPATGPPALDSPKPNEPAPLPGQPLLPNADWVSPATAAWRNRALTAIAVVVGVVLALLASFLFTSGRDADPSPPPRSPETAQVDLPLPSPAATTSIPAPETDTTSEPDTEADTTSEPDTAAGSAATPDAEIGSETPPEVATPTEPAPADSAQPPAPDAIPDGPEATAPDKAAADADPVSDGAPDTTAKPESAPNEATAEAPPGLVVAAEDPNATDGSAGSVADMLREFGALLDLPEAATSDMAKAEPDPEVTPEGDAADGNAALIRPGAREVDVNARLQDTIAAIDFQKIPLKKFLRFISDYSTIPITLDADSLVWLKITPVAPITVVASESTVADVLNEALAPLGLYYRIEGQQLFVTRRPKNETGLRTAKFKVADLVGDDSKALQRLGEMITDLVEPGSWTQHGGDGSLQFEGTMLVVEQAEPVLFEVLTFCQKMRVARGLPVGGTYAPSIFRLDTRTARAGEKLAQPISLTYIRPAPFERIIDRIAETARIHVLIDWRALAQAEWSPDAVVAFATAGEPLSEALDELLQPMDLAYRVVSESVLQVTTVEAYENRLEVEFYRLGKLLDGQSETDVLQAIHRSLGNDRFRGSGGDSLVTIDPAHKLLLACMPQAQQVRLERWLAEQQAGGADLGTTIPTAAAEFRIAPVSDPGSSD